MLIELIIEDFLAWRERQAEEQEQDSVLLSQDLEELKELGFAPTPDHDEE